MAAQQLLFRDTLGIKRVSIQTNVGSYVHSQQNSGTGILLYGSAEMPCITRFYKHKQMSVQLVAICDGEELLLHSLCPDGQQVILFRHLFRQASKFCNVVVLYALGCTMGLLISQRPQLPGPARPSHPEVCQPAQNGVQNVRV